MTIHRSRYGIGADSERPGRWYIWSGPELVGFADRNTEPVGPNWLVFKHAGPNTPEREIPGGAHDLDAAVRRLVRDAPAQPAGAR